MQLPYTSRVWTLFVLLVVLASPALAQETQPGNSEPKQEQAQPQSTPSAPVSNTDIVDLPASSPQTQKGENKDESLATPPAQTNSCSPQKAPSKPTPTKSKSLKKRTRPATAGKIPKRKPNAAGPDNQSGKVVVKNGGTRNDGVQLSTPGTTDQQRHSRENTIALLASTDENMKSLAERQLTPTQQSTLDQIRSYMQQAKSAMRSGDLDRAHTLADKAHLLSADLARH